MSVQAMAWAIEQRFVTDAPTRHVLLCLANYADKTGRGAFPSASTLADETGLSERTVRYKLDTLAEAGLIRLGAQSLASAYIERADRRPVVWDLAIERGAGDAPREAERGAADDTTGCSSRHNGVQELHPIRPLSLKASVSSCEPDGSCASADADAPAGRIPYQAIIDLYNGTMTGLAKVREITAKRRTLIRSAWQASPKRRSLTFWTSYLAECQDDDFLNGSGPYREPHANWRPGFDYLLRADVVTKVYERALDRMEREP